MNAFIEEYQFPAQGEFTLWLPKLQEINVIKIVKGRPSIVAIIIDNDHFIDRKFKVAKTGDRVDIRCMAFITSFQIVHEGYLYHLFEVI